MAVQAITINSVTFYVSNVRRNKRRIGTAFEAANGARRFAYRSLKHEFEVTIEDGTEAQRASLAAIAALTTTFPFVDQHGASYTCLCLEDAMSDEISDISTVSGGQQLSYTLTLRFVEA